jgi:hypothetical protein
MKKLLILLIPILLISGCIGTSQTYEDTNFTCSEISLDVAKQLENEHDVKVVHGIYRNEGHAWLEVDGKYIEPQDMSRVWWFEGYNPIFTLNVEDYEDWQLYRSEESVFQYESFEWV